LKVWYDACTGKHVRYGVAVAQRLRRLGHEVTLTTRRHPDTIALLELLDEKCKIVGEYAPNSQSSRLKEGLKRQLAFCEMFERDPPDYAISHGSVDLCRVAFGLGIPIISTADAPHATAANKLGLPLVDVLISSKAIPQRVYKAFGVANIIQFEGVDEVAWVKNRKLEPEECGEPVIVVRLMETKASYAIGERDATETIAQKLVHLGKVTFLPRYDRRARPNLTVPPSLVDSVNLSATASIVISAGGTLSREAALQGTPSIVIRTFGKSYVNDYLSDMGFPLFTVEQSEVLGLVKKHLGQRRDVKELLERLEDPVDYIEAAIKRCESP